MHRNKERLGRIFGRSGRCCWLRVSIIVQKTRNYRPSPNRSERKEIRDNQDTLHQHKTLDPERTYLPCYTDAAIEAMQTEDDDLENLYKWVDDRELPTREEAASCNPSVRKYWLEAESLIRSFIANSGIQEIRSHTSYSCLSQDVCVKS